MDEEQKIDNTSPVNPNEDAQHVKSADIPVSRVLADTVGEKEGGKPVEPTQDITMTETQTTSSDLEATDQSADGSESRVLSDKVEEKGDEPTQDIPMTEATDNSADDSALEVPPVEKQGQHENNPKPTKNTVESDTTIENSDPNASSEPNPNPKPSFHLETSLKKEELLSRMRAVIYGNCIGDAIGLLTEFMTKEEAREIYGSTVEEKRFYGFSKSKKHALVEELELEYDLKHDDFHRSRWHVGDWTDDSDQMILILRTLLDKHGKVDFLDFAKKFKVWTRNGFEELGDHGGMGIGATTHRVISKRDFLTDPHKCAYKVWDESGRWAAPNGGVMRTSILGIQDFSHIPTVIYNTRKICKVTHADPRCVASCVAVTTAIALMLQGKHYKEGGYDEEKICKEAYEYACKELKTEQEKKELKKHMFAKTLSVLELSGDDKIGYTYKCLGAGFWAFRQKDFRRAMTELVMEAGDADTNGAVAGALLGCKLGVEHLPETWLNGLVHKGWLDKQIDRYFAFLLENTKPEPDPSLSKVFTFCLESSLKKEELLSHIRAVIYGNCIGDAIGLLTEFMTKEEAQEIYPKNTNIPVEKLELEYHMKYDDFHRGNWEVGDWTDDSDQMILILRTLLDNKGKTDVRDFAKKFKVWTRSGYEELGDHGGMGIGQTTYRVISQRDFSADPHKCAYQVWDESGRWAAPNGGVMRTSILGIQDFSHIPTVIYNTRKICKVTHADPRCVASCVAVTTAIALMLQGKHYKEGGYDEEKICEEAYKYACKELKTDEEKRELREHMFAETLSELKLSGDDKIEYTYKCLGAGFWAFKQGDFRRALTELVMEAGDADTNGAVAGALLGCKLGVEHLPETWLYGLLHKGWLDEQIERYFNMLGVETERTRRNSEHQAADLQRSLTAERKAKKETEETLNSVMEKAHQLQSSLSAQTQSREEIQERLHRSDQRAYELETSLAAKTQAKEETERRLNRSDQRARELETSLAAQTQARRETEGRLNRSDQRARELETSLAAQTQARRETERQRDRSDQTARELEISLAAHRQARRETELRLRNVQQQLRMSMELPCDWILERDQIILSNTKIGEGGWGEVFEGTFGGCKVAVKVIYPDLISHYNRFLFEREMNVASKCHHPCLLQFIGATNDQSPFLVTELLDTSLRAVLHERSLEPAEIKTIAMDVAKGLNYLHLKRPAPIIHRDVSSANVLLWKKGADWRAKVSDYGTAKFLQDVMTKCPGAQIYSAPEAQTSTQSPKVDVYSFGVLLCEMNIGEQPDVQTRNQQIARVTNHFYRGLIRRCVHRNADKRPTMAEIIQEINDSTE